MEEAHLVAVSPGTPIVQGWCDALWRGVLRNTLEPRGGGGGAPQPGDHGTHGRDMIVLACSCKQRPTSFLGNVLMWWVGIPSWQ